MTDSVNDTGAPVIPVLIGPTAVGKSEIVLSLASEFNADILILDAYKVYRQFEAGVTKPTAEELRKIPHFGLDRIDIFEETNVSQVIKNAEQVIDAHTVKNRLLIIEGNAPMYLKVLFEGMFEGPGQDLALREQLNRQAEQKGVGFLFDRLRQQDPVSAKRIEKNDLKRIVRALEVWALTGRSISDLQKQWGQLRQDRLFSVAGIYAEKEYHWNRLEGRVRQLLTSGGWIDECRRVLELEKKSGRELSKTALQTEGYAQIFEFIRNGYTCEGTAFEQLVESIFIGHRQNAKRSMQWYRKWKQVKWVERTVDKPVQKMADEVKQIWIASGVPLEMEM